MAERSSRWDWAGCALSCLFKSGTESQKGRSTIVLTSSAQSVFTLARAEPGGSSPSSSLESGWRVSGDRGRAGGVPAALAAGDAAAPDGAGKVACGGRSGVGGERAAGGFVRRFSATSRAATCAVVLPSCKCGACHESTLVAFQPQAAGLCPLLRGAPLAQAALHCEQVLPEAAYRQRTLSAPFRLWWALVKDARLFAAVEKRLVWAIFRWQRIRRGDSGGAASCSARRWCSRSTSARRCSCAGAAPICSASQVSMVARSHTFNEPSRAAWGSSPPWSSGTASCCVVWESTRTEVSRGEPLRVAIVRRRAPLPLRRPCQRRRSRRLRGGHLHRRPQRGDPLHLGSQASKLLGEPSGENRLQGTGAVEALG
jgi:hypothetical protein